jgi:hypothetical protein
MTHPQMRAPRCPKIFCRVACGLKAARIRDAFHDYDA